MTRQRRLEALYVAQRAAEVNRQLKQYIAERDRISPNRNDSYAAKSLVTDAG
jgi:hypothetical protein